MNVLFYISSLRCGGAERVASTLLREWVSAGHEVTLVTSAPPNTDYFPKPSQVARISLDLNYGAASLPVKIYRNLRRIFTLRKAIRDVAPSIIVSFMDGNNVIAILASLGMGTPVVISERSDPTRSEIPKAWTVLRRLTYHWADLLVVQSNMQREWASRNFPHLNAIVIPNPLGIEPPAGHSHTSSVFASAGSKRPKVMVTVGRLAPEKQLGKLIATFANFCDRVEGWTLQIVGEGYERPALESAISASRHQGRMLLMGAASDPSLYYANARIYIMCSKFEGFPNSVIEAMAFGAATIGFNCAGCLEDIVEHRKSGLIVQADDWDELLKLLVELAADDEQQVAMGRAAATKAQSFSSALVADLWLQEMNKLISAR